MNRRDFILNSARLGTWVAVSDTLPWLAYGAATKSVLVVGHVDREPVQDFDEATAVSMAGDISIFEPQTGATDKISCAILPHGFCQSPTEPSLLIGVEKWTNQAVVFDLRKRALIRHLQAPASMRFFGHAAFDPTGQTFFISAIQGRMSESFLVVFDRKTWQIKKVIEVGGFGSHEVTLSPDGTSLLVANMRPPIKLKTKNNLRGEVVAISVRDGTVLRRYATPFCSHISWIDEHTVILAGSDRETKLPSAAHLSSLDLKSGKITECDETREHSKPIPGEALSIARYDKDHVLATVLGTNKLLFWNFRENKLLVQDSGHEHLGVADFNGMLYLNQNQSGQLSTIRFDSGKLTERLVRGPTHMGHGRHLYTFNYES